ncbi:hypothetical protein OV207_17960 [Corallococcus sp. BB11-1]|uniref:hypothetical protein n=1 Tax=Corallococcus sp. BB11-1 TaxID=2996783 RepID=UPI0022722D21|nr:hypothetical protein [Corallococcus sp. BB11-1]MCY1033344.1 hypothetical protein [Corallococcus sp. BB11-1]
MLRRFVSYAVPAASLMLGGCGPETLEPSTAPAEAPGTVQQGLSTITINDFPLGFYVPPKTGGDEDFAGNGPKMDIDFEMEVRNGNELWVAMRIWGHEVGGTTKVHGDQFYHIATTTSPIVSISPTPWPFSQYSANGPEFHFEYTDMGHSLDAWFFPQLTSNTRIVQNLTCVGDTSGDEAGSRTGCSAVLHDLTITF